MAKLEIGKYYVNPYNDDQYLEVIAEDDSWWRIIRITKEGECGKTALMTKTLYLNVKFTLIFNLEVWKLIYW